MDSGQDLSSTAALIADPTRAEMLLVLMDGRAFPVSELAAFAHVSLPTASHHLAKLVEGGLLAVERHGRHSYHRIASENVAALIEQIAAVGGRVPGQARHSPKQAALAHCRTCYNHLAGAIGVRIRAGLESRDFIIERDGRYRVTPSGEAFFTGLGLDMAEPGKQVGKVCMDWTERVPHVGGALGAALYAGLLDQKWVARGEVPRQVRVTQAGSVWIEEAFPVCTQTGPTCAGL